MEQSKLEVDQLTERLEIARKQLQGQFESAATRLAVLQSELDQATAMASLKDRQGQDL